VAIREAVAASADAVAANTAQLLEELAVVATGPVEALEADNAGDLARARVALDLYGKSVLSSAAMCRALGHALVEFAEVLDPSGIARELEGRAAYLGGELPPINTRKPGGELN
jgi:hypothetical protein